MTDSKKYIRRDIHVVRVTAFQVTDDLDAACRKINIDCSNWIRGHLYHNGKVLFIAHSDRTITTVHPGDWITQCDGELQAYSDGAFADQFTDGPITVAA